MVAVTVVAEEDMGPTMVQDLVEDLECRVPVVVVSIEDGKTISFLIFRTPLYRLLRGSCNARHAASKLLNV